MGSQGSAELGQYLECHEPCTYCKRTCVIVKPLSWLTSSMTRRCGLFPLEIIYTAGLLFAGGNWCLHINIFLKFN